MRRVGADFFEGLEGANTDTARSLSEEVGGFGDSGSGGFFTFGGNDGGAAFAFSFGLLSHGTFHVGRKLDILELDAFDVDTPFVGLGVDDFADLDGNFVTFAEDFVKIEITGDIAKSGLSKSASGIAIVGSLEDGFASINNASINNSIHIDSDVVTGDDFLFGDIHRSGANIDFEHFVDIRDNDTKTGV